MAITVNGITASTDDPFDLYRQLISDVFVAERGSDHEAGSKASASFHADVRACTVGSMFLHYGLHGAARFDRDAARVRRDGLDDLAILAVEAGRFTYRTGDSEGVIAPGQSLVIDRSRPLHLEAGTNIQATLNVPRELARKLSGDPAYRAAGLIRHGEVLDGSTGALVSGVITAIGRTGPSGPRPEATLCRLLEQVLDRRYTAISPDDPAEDARNRLLNARAQIFMQNNLDDPALSIDAICTGVGASRSKLYRAFPVEGVSAALRRLRLAHALFLLTRHPALRVEAVARQCGFASAPAFSTQFRRKYGISPRAARAGTPPRGGRGILDGKARMARWRQVLVEADRMP